MTMDIVNRLGAKMIAVIVAVICITIATCLNPFTDTPSYALYVGTISGLLGLGGGIRIWEKRKR